MNDFSRIIMPIKKLNVENYPRWTPYYGIFHIFSLFLTLPKAMNSKNKKYRSLMGARPVQCNEMMECMGLEITKLCTM